MNTALRKALAPALDPPRARHEKEPLMAAKLDYHWHLRKVMADRGHVRHHRSDRAAGANAASRLSSSQVYRLVVERPERLSLKILMALLDILDCSMDDLIEPVAAGRDGRQDEEGGRRARPVIGDLRPKRARIHGVGQS